MELFFQSTKPEAPDTTTIWLCCPPRCRVPDLARDREEQKATRQACALSVSSLSLKAVP